MERLFRWANIGLVLLTLGAYCSSFLSPTIFWPFALPGLFLPWFLLFNVLFIVGWILVRKKYWLLSLGCLIIGWSYIRGVVGLNMGGSAAPSKEAIGVMTYNCHDFRPPKNPRERISPKDLGELINDLKPSVVCFQEFPAPPSLSNPYIDYLTQNTHLKYYIKPKRGALAIFSSYPIGNYSFRFFSNNANGYLYGDIKTGDFTFRVYNIHLQTNAVSRMADRMAADHDIQERETWLRLKGMMGRYGRSARERVIQAREIADAAAKCEHPVVLAGDMNDVPASYAYRTLAKGRTDAFKRRGSGLGTTFAGKIPGLRIDYVLADPQLSVLDAEVRPTQYSDHYPVVGWLRKK